ncbi:RICIN domain-containing protein [Streptomyces sp. RKAG293]|uniref:RICIN domain-containing protein n=1 Tax=Streptomyces sp. RKAG293 TaxID=2893403 RepID=UPI002033C80E|nr:RICIN domain-containing protein [Streptomyces sp. RKAG293]MCM2416815.1 RICIN domain-containing protein [Streptomyces sp. RKAG293]
MTIPSGGSVTLQPGSTTPPVTVFQIVNRRSGKAIDVAEASTDQGAQLIQYTPHTGANQRFSCTPGTGRPTTVTCTNSSLVWDVSGGSTAAGAKIIQWTPNGGANQQWQLIPG